MRELISCITVSASGKLTEPLKWTLLGGIAILSVTCSRVRLQWLRTADRRELSDAASVNTTPACSMLTPRRSRHLGLSRRARPSRRSSGPSARVRSLAGYSLRVVAKALAAGLLSATSMTLARLGGLPLIGSPGSGARAASADRGAVGCSLRRSFLRRTLARRRAAYPYGEMLLEASSSASDLFRLSPLPRSGTDALLFSELEVVP
jgi:hypothetical protein